MSRFKKNTFCEKENNVYEIMDVTERYVIARVSYIQGKKQRYKLDVGEIEETSQNDYVILDRKIFSATDFK